MAPRGGTRDKLGSEAIDHLGQWDMAEAGARTSGLFAILDGLRISLGRIGFGAGSPDSISDATQSGAKAAVKPVFTKAIS
ncbi:hypothetical protein NKH73_14615 [Mesorhizobium sp. M0938]|uniref:hypothetical protein n=1 Tax=unclassified Mesorhizobium TaxID=325217 RepID=UPI00333CC55E